MLLKALCTTVVAATLISGSIPVQRASHTGPDASLGELHELGVQIAKAVIAKDPDALLRYDRADLRADDQRALKDSKSELFCYLFDTSCMQSSPQGWLSVY